MRFATLATVAAITLAAAPAVAASDVPDGYVTITAKSANIGVGWSWGDGILHWHHHTYRFSIKGLNVAAVGFSTVTGHGRVYNLHHLHDFDGTYFQSHGEVTVGQGIGGSLYANGNGVSIHVDDTAKGVQFAGSSSGIEFHIEN